MNQLALWPAASPSAGLQRPTRPTLLIVDDEPLLAEYMGSIGEDAGWAVEIATSAAEFEAKLKSLQPDAVALDLAMPGRDGVELLRHLKSRGFAGRLIIVSACDRPIVETSANLAREHGLNVIGYIGKPIPAETFALLLGQPAFDDGAQSQQ